MVTALNIIEVGAVVKDLENVEDITTLLLAGHLGRDAELKITPNGNWVAGCSLATNTRESVTDEDGVTTWKDSTQWWRTNRWGENTANAVAEHWKKGRRIEVEAAFVLDPETGGPVVYQTKAGDSQASYEINVLSWGFGGGNGNGGRSVSDDSYQMPVYDDEDDDIPF
jgi:single stranded DNA-binding protein